jgi:acyl carrier protein
MDTRAHQVRNELARLLNCEPERLAMEKSFHEMGVDSLVGMRLIGKISDATGHEIEPTVLFDYPTIRELATYLDTMLVDRVS